MPMTTPKPTSNGTLILPHLPLRFGSYCAAFRDIDLAVLELPHLGIHGLLNDAAFI